MKIDTRPTCAGCKKLKECKTFVGAIAAEEELATEAGYEVDEGILVCEAAQTGCGLEFQRFSSVSDAGEEQIGRHPLDKELPVDFNYRLLMQSGLVKEFLSQQET
jgi:hypothetical protein